MREGEEEGNNIKSNFDYNHKLSLRYTVKMAHKMIPQKWTLFIAIRLTNRDKKRKENRKRYFAEIEDGACMCVC